MLVLEKVVVVVVVVVVRVVVLVIVLVIVLVAVVFPVVVLVTVIVPTCGVTAQAPHMRRHGAITGCAVTAQLPPAPPQVLTFTLMKEQVFEILNIERFRKRQA